MLDGNFPIQHINVPKEERLDEQLGSKTKFWFEVDRGRDDDRPKLLWKCARLNTFEDISEKLTAELGKLLGIPVATVELAQCDGARGTITLSFLAKGDRLVHGNEVLTLLDQSYAGGARYHAKQHTVEAAIGALDWLGVAPWPDWGTSEVGTFRASDLFVGYLLFDAWIGNTDRHHENWAIVQRGSARYLTPSYDHASSLGRDESPTEVNLRLYGNDSRHTVEAYAARARSAFFAPNSGKTIHPANAFLRAEQVCPGAASYWRQQLDAVRSEDIDTLVDRVPEALWSTTQGAFVKRLLKVNRERIRSAHV